MTIKTDFVLKTEIHVRWRLRGKNGTAVTQQDNNCLQHHCYHVAHQLCIPTSSVCSCKDCV